MSSFFIYCVLESGGLISEGGSNVRFLLTLWLCNGAGTCKGAVEQPEAGLSQCLGGATEPCCLYKLLEA